MRNFLIRACGMLEENMRTVCQKLNTLSATCSWQAGGLGIKPADCARIVGAVSTPLSTVAGLVSPLFKGQYSTVSTGPISVTTIYKENLGDIV